MHFPTKEVRIIMANDVQQVNNQFILDLYDASEGDGQRWSDDGILMIRSSGDSPSRVFMSGQPFLHSDTFVGVVMEGSFDCIINLQNHHLTTGDILLVTKESILQAVGDVGEFHMQVLHLSDQLMAEIFNGQIPPIYHQRMNGILLHPTGAENELVLSMLNTLWIAVHTEYRENRNIELFNFLQLLRNMAVRKNHVTISSQPHNVQIFNRFIQLVNEHCEQHRDMDFYANRICLNKQYLSSIISDVSHKKASSWIEEALVARAKVLLRHDDLTVNEISDKLGFSEPSNLTRYFKRATGMTPLEYRNGK